MACGADGLYSRAMTHTLRYSDARFLQSAQTLPQCPGDTGMEVAFAGRSNAGKSSAINVLTRQSKLARISKTPGRTQLINFFSLDEQLRLVDLPGYGYAKVSRAVKVDWERNLADYLQHRQSLRLLVLVMDIRHPLRDYDWQMLKWASHARLPVHILLTKADKFKRGPAKDTLMAVEREIAQAGLDNITLQTFSALKKTGLDDLEAVLNHWLCD